MKIENLKKARVILGEELSTCRNEIGTDQVYYLCETISRLDRLIFMLEKPEKYAKIKKSMTLGQ